MPNDPDQIAFIPVETGHYPLLRAWLNEPHVREWWGDAEDELSSIRNMVEGHDSTRPFIIQVDGEPVGYIQCWFIAHQTEQLKNNPWLAELPSDTVGVDLTIGSPDKVSKGIGSKALKEFVRMLLENGHRTIIIDPDRDNARAVRAYVKAGFRPISRLEGRTGSALIMQYDPNITEMTI